MTRVKKGCHFHLTEFKPEYIQANKEVEKKMKSMMVFSPHQFKQVYLDQDLFINPSKEMKIGYININGLYNAESCSMINNDFNLLQLDILQIADTRLSNCEGDLQLGNDLSNWRVALREDSDDKRKHMGMLLLVSKQSMIKMEQVEMNSKKGFKTYGNDIKMVYVQLVRIQVKNMKIGFVYIRETPNADELEVLVEAFRHSDCIMGDLNLDPAREQDREKLQKLCGPKRIRILHEHTTTRSNQLDHIIMHSHLSTKVFATSYINHTTDHRTISVRIPLNGNKFSEHFKRDWFFDKEKFTRQPDNVEELKHMADTTEFGFSNVDAYLDILKEVRRDTVIFNLYVMADLSQKDFQDLDPSLKSLHILKGKYVMIPIKMRKIQGVAILTVGKGIELHFTQLPSKEDLKDLLFIIVRDYMRLLYQSLKLEVPDFEIQTTENKVRPANPDQQWVYLLTYLKSKLFDQDLKYEDFDFQKHEKVMMTEIRARKVIQMSKPKPVLRQTKRKLKEQYVEDPRPKKQKIAHRYFSNPDQASCWMNSCLQAVLTALDHLNSPVQNGSPFYNYLMYFQDSERVMPLDPTEIKNLIFHQEKRRIVETNVSPVFRHFHFEGTTSSNEADLCVEVLERQRQQDCRDFFSCILSNKKAWPDVSNLFEFSIEEFTVCLSCGFSSRSGKIEDVPFLPLDCPSHSTPLQEMIEKLNGQSVRKDWKCESVCKRVTGGKHFTKVIDVSSITFFTTVVNRLIRHESGSLKILNTKCSVTDNVTITDSFGQSAVFSPIAVIHHSGIVTQKNDTCGHYRADVRSTATDEWFQTSDDQIPLKVPLPSDQCYITIFKKEVETVK